MDERRQHQPANDTRKPALPPGHYDAWQGQLSLHDPTRLPLDHALAAFARDYRDHSAAERAMLRAAVTTDDGYTLLAFARRSAVFGLRSGDSVDLADGLCACAAIDHERIDYRDVFVALGLLHHAAMRTGDDPAAMLRSAAALGDEGLVELVEGFLVRPAAERDLRDACGYMEVESPGGIGLIRRGSAPWTPSGDLIAASLRLAGAMRSDDYLIEDPELAVKLPPIWLSAANDPELAPILGASRGGAVIHARLRPEVTPAHADQGLTIWLLELGDPAAAHRLEHLARTPRTGDVLLGVAVGPLFAILVARALVVGVTPYENSDRLSRFAPAVKGALADYT